MFVKAKRTFNYGGIVQMNANDHDDIKDSIAKKLIELGLVVENVPSYKRIKVKTKKDEPIDKADNTDSE